MLKVLYKDKNSLQSIILFIEILVQFTYLKNVIFEKNIMKKASNVYKNPIKFVLYFK